MDSSSSSSSNSTFSSSSQPNHTLISFPFALTIKNMLTSMMVSSENRQDFCYLRNGGGLEVALMENAASFLAPLPFNPTFLSAILMFASQGMPSTRSARCSALTTSVAVKRHAGYQAMVVNTLLGQLFDLEEHPVIEERPEEDLGDTLPQVLTGALFGSTVAVLCCLGFMMLR
ncbi:hypothetical protein RYX36_030223 [Vicia faba]